jgi:clan AA aspartic protease
MIVGSVDAGRGPLIGLRSTGPTGQSEEVRAVVDTGFSGSLSIPRTLVDWLSLERRQSAKVRLADGETHFFDRYRVQIHRDGRPREILAFAMGDELILGMALLEGHRLTIDAVDGGPVTIEPIV